jgi:hypothetical protein
MAEVVDDADTGQEILHFIRRGRHFLWLRDKVTRRFIRRLKYVEKRLYMVVEYSVEEARKGNPLYIDAVICTQLNPEEFYIREHIIPQLERALRDFVRKYFGSYVVDLLLDVAGEEYGSRPHYKTKYEEHKATCAIVWKHHPEERPKSVEEVVTL